MLLQLQTLKIFGSDRISMGSIYMYNDEQTTFAKRIF